MHPAKQGFPVVVTITRVSAENHGEEPVRFDVVQFNFDGCGRALVLAFKPGAATGTIDYLVEDQIVEMLSLANKMAEPAYALTLKQPPLMSFRGKSGLLPLMFRNIDIYFFNVIGTHAALAVCDGVVTLLSPRTMVSLMIGFDGYAENPYLGSPEVDALFSDRMVETLLNAADAQS